MRGAVLLVLLVASIPGFADEAWACSCASVSPCSLYRTSDAVFVGDVEDVGYPRGPDQTVQMRVIRRGKGIGDTGQLVTVHTSRGTCGLDIKSGQRWMIFGHAGPTGIRTGLCDGSYQLAPADQLPELPPRGGAVHGRLRTPGPADGAVGGMADVPAWIDTPNGRLATRTGADGGFTLVGVPPGGWTVKFDVGPEQTAQAYVELAASVDCYGVNAFLGPAGGLAGSVVDSSGAPVVDARVTAILAADTEGIYEFDGRTDDSGEFRITLTPGSYLLGVSLDEEPNGRVPYGRQFYPTARERASAQAIEVGRTIVRLEPIVMRAPLPTVTIAVDIVCRDGTRPTKAYVAAERLDGSFANRDHSSVHGTDGRRTVRVLRGPRYTLRGFVGVKTKRRDASIGDAWAPTIPVETRSESAPDVVRLRADLEGCDAPGGIWIDPR